MMRFFLSSLFGWLGVKGPTREQVSRGVEEEEEEEEDVTA